MIDPSKPHLQLRDLTAGFGSGNIFQGVSLCVPRGQTLVVLGESGCGKTTLLRAIAGLIPLRSGEIELDAKTITDVPPESRRVIYLDQEPLLFEHLTIAENIGFAMQLRGAPRDEIETQVARMLAAIDLTEHTRKREWQLSGGQKQRVAFARAILARPQLLLLDEPFASLDGPTRGQMQTLFRELTVQFGLTSLFVTHDVKEALIVGNLYARMEQEGVTLYPDRASFVAAPQTGVTAELEFWKRASDM